MYLQPFYESVGLVVPLLLDPYLETTVQYCHKKIVVIRSAFNNVI